MKMQSLATDCSLILIWLILLPCHSTGADEVKSHKISFFDFSSDEGKEILSEATAISVEDMKQHFNVEMQRRQGKIIEKGRGATEPMAWILYVIATKKDPWQLAEFEWMGGSDGARLAKWASNQAKNNGGRIRFMNPNEITNVSWTGSGTCINGIVAFDVKGLFKGKMQFIARASCGKWTIDQFILPAHGIQTTRNEHGIWKMGKQH